MAKRASTEYSFVIGIDKPAGITSHDVVNRVRRIYGERRVGHTGTLDPAATGALVVCVGPATRLDRFLTGHEKTYEFSVVFGTSTDTDDAQGEVVSTAPISEALGNTAFATQQVEQLQGQHRQLPPAYSAVRVQGKKAYELARAGKAIDFKPRTITVLEAKLLGVEQQQDAVVWRIEARVSAGTYVRSLARDLGVSLGTVAHVGSLRRTSCGGLDVGMCVSLDALEQDKYAYLVDPVRLLEYRVVFARDGIEEDIAHGRSIAAEGAPLYSYEQQGIEWDLCSCSSGLRKDARPCVDGEFVSVVAENRLKAIYSYQASTERFQSACGFSIGVQRGNI